MHWRRFERWRHPNWMSYTSMETAIRSHRTEDRKIWCDIQPWYNDHHLIIRNRIVYLLLYCLILIKKFMQVNKITNWRIFYLFEKNLIFELMEISLHSERLCGTSEQNLIHHYQRKKNGHYVQSLNAFNSTQFDYYIAHSQILM